MANNWREKAALVSDRAIVLSTRRSLRPTRNLFRRRRAALPSRVEQTAVQKPPNQGESIPPPKSGVSPERAIAPTHASFNFTSNQPEAACRVVVANQLLRAAHGRSRANFNPVECSAASWQPHPSARMYDTQ
ncbi:hypothetical protein AnigIFM63309_011043 [Aspergillus niger]|nr:hypothetical protein AnigIFM63309_011043 [Aspergillus niger]